MPQGIGIELHEIEFRAHRITLDQVVESVYGLIDTLQLFTAAEGSQHFTE